MGSKKPAISVRQARLTPLPSDQAIVTD